MEADQASINFQVNLDGLSDVVATGVLLAKWDGAKKAVTYSLNPRGGLTAGEAKALLANIKGAVTFK
jgi:hypothetical protein